MAKVTCPKPVDVWPRARLDRRVKELLRTRGIPWVVAPAGSGKTVLLASYVRAKKVPTIWYRVDEGDQHAEDLFHYLRLGADTLGSSRRTGASLPVFSRAVDVERFSRRFFEALFARLPPGGVIAFDDYHWAPEGTPWQTALAIGLASIPSGKNVIVSSRCAPPSALARLAVHGDIELLEANELFFTKGETVALAKRKLGSKRKTITHEDGVGIHAATGGWPVAVSVLVRTAQVPPSGAEPNMQPLFDYLANVVFSGLSPEKRRLLLHTACVRSFTAEAAESLSGMSGAAAALSALQRSGLFLERDDAKATVFRYHDLFRSFLLDLASRTLTAAELTCLRTRAAALLRGEGRCEEAFELLCAANDEPGLIKLVLEFAPSLFGQGRVGLLTQWVQVLSESAIRAAPQLEYWRAMCRLTVAPSESRIGFERALDSFLAADDGAGAYLAWAGAVQALTYEGRAWHTVGDWLARLEELERKYPAFASPDVGSQVAGALVIGLTVAGAASGDIDGWMTRALALADAARTPSVRLLTASALVLNCALRGNTAATEILIARLEQRTDIGDADWFAGIAALGAKTALAWHQGDTAAALRFARDGLALMGERPAPFWQVPLLVFGGFAAVVRDQDRELCCFLDRLANIAESGEPLDVGCYHTVRAAQALARGDTTTAMRAVELSIGAGLAIGFPYGLGVDFQLLAYAAFECGEVQKGHAALEHARRVENDYRDPVLPYWRLLVEADRALRDGDRALASERLRSAFAIGQEKHLYGGLFPHGQRLAELCRHALREGIDPAYTRELIKRAKLRPQPPPLDVDGWPWPIRIHTIARVEVSIGEEPPVALRAPVQALLLKAIVMLGSNGRPISVGKLGSMLWPDADGDTAIQTFDVTLLRLRKRLGGNEIVRLEGGCVALDRSVCWTDIDALEAALKEVGVLGNTEPIPPSEILSSISARLLSLCPRQHECAYALPAALIGLEERLRSRVASALCTLGELWEQIGDLSSAETTYRRALDEELAPELLLPAAVRCMIRCGRTNDARSLFETWRRRGIESERAAAMLKPRAVTSR